jgi:hypothetical protein
LKKYQDQGNLETTMAKKRTRDVMEGLEQEVLEQHKRYGPETLTCTRKESGHLLSLSDSSLATAHFNESYLLRRQEGGVTLLPGHPVLILQGGCGVVTGSSCLNREPVPT